MLMSKEFAYLLLMVFHGLNHGYDITEQELLLKGIQSAMVTLIVSKVVVINFK